MIIPQGNKSKIKEAVVEAKSSRMEKILSSGIPRNSHPTGQKWQYQSMLRSQHGIWEMADAEDLDEISKSLQKGKGQQ